MKKIVGITTITVVSGSIYYGTRTPGYPKYGSNFHRLGHDFQLHRFGQITKDVHTVKTNVYSDTKDMPNNRVLLKGQVCLKCGHVDAYEELSSDGINLMEIGSTSVSPWITEREYQSIKKHE